MHVYARLLSIHHQNGHQLTADEEDFIEQIHRHPCAMSKLTSLYLSGFENSAIPGSVESHFQMLKPQFNEATGIPGFFGSVIQRPGDYMSYPCPGVLAQRMMEDLRLTGEPEREAAWSIAPV